MAKTVKKLVINFSDKGLDELIQFIVQEGESSHD